MPAAWRAKIVADLAQQSPAVVGSIGSVQRNPWNRKWLTALAAAVLLIASVAVLHVTQRQDSSSGSPLPSTVATVRPMAPSEFSEADIRTVSFDLLSPREVERFDRRHNGCATMTQKLREADWPGNIELLPGALTSHLGAQPYPVLDLSAAGYQFAGAGPCGIPGEPAVHLLYRGEHDTISLWLRPDDGRYDIPEDHFYQTTGENSKHSLLVWRHSGIIYYLVGDNPSHARKACSVLSECDKKKK